IVELSLASGGDVNKTSGGWGTPLAIALLHGHADMVRFLLSHGAEPDHRFGMSLGDSEIMRVASSYDRLNIVEISLANGGDANKFLLGYESPLAAAALRGHGDMVRFLLSKGADPNYQDERWHALLYAAKMGHAHVVKILWEAGATPTWESRWSPLTRAAQHGHCHVIETFLDLGHSIKGKYKDAADEALCRAAAAGHESIVRLLVKRGVGKDG
ncbi:ankyrin repeat-containing domain protein, partial [Halenospora varia]